MAAHIFVLHGDDTQALERFVDGLAARLGDPSVIDLNMTRLEGKTASEEEIRSAAFAMPFLATQRLVVLTQPLSRAEGEAGRKRLVKIMDELPESTLLALVIDDRLQRRGWEVLKEGHWLLKWVAGQNGRAEVKAFPLPGPADMPAWILAEARKQGGVFEPEGAEALAAAVGAEPLIAVQEIGKLLTYTNFARPVTRLDVELLVTSTTPVSIFDMVDALAMRDGRKAMVLLGRLLEDEDAERVFAMVVRQFRLLIQAREVLDEGGTSPAVAAALAQPGFVADKLVRQAQRFSMAQLREIYHRLLEMDTAFKMSEIDTDLALEVFIADVCR